MFIEHRFAYMIFIKSFLTFPQCHDSVMRILTPPASLPYFVQDHFISQHLSCLFFLHCDICWLAAVPLCYIVLGAQRLDMLAIICKNSRHGYLYDCTSTSIIIISKHIFANVCKALSAGLSISSSMSSSFQHVNIGELLDFVHEGIHSRHVFLFLSMHPHKDW